MDEVSGLGYCKFVDQYELVRVLESTTECKFNIVDF